MDATSAAVALTCKILELGLSLIYFGLLQHRKAGGVDGPALMDKDIITDQAGPATNTHRHGAAQVCGRRERRACCILSADFAALALESSRLCAACVADYYFIRPLAHVSLYMTPRHSYMGYYI